MWLFIILLCLFLWFLIRPYLRIRRAIRDAQRRADGFFRGANRDQYGRGGYASRPRPKRRHKKIDPSVGEYVEFEEINVFSSPDQTEEPSKTDFTPEPQIEDAEWEEIK